MGICGGRVVTSSDKLALSKKLAAELREYNERLDVSRSARTVPDSPRPRVENAGRYCYVAEDRPKP